eukprot:COSAG02_NODE_2841_length_7913_cov_7.374840_3_plen_626_part_00
MAGAVGEKVAAQKASPGGGGGAVATGRGWAAVNKIVSVSRRLCDPVKLKRDEQRLQRKHGTNIGPNADSPRWDVQQTYRQLFFPHRQRICNPDDPFVDDGLSGHWSSIVAGNSAHGARERMHVVDSLKRRFKSASVKMAMVSFLPEQYHACTLAGAPPTLACTALLPCAQHGATWGDLFEQYDTDGSGSLGMEEFLLAVRIDGRIRADQISDKQVQQLFEHIDTDHSGGISLSELTAFVSKTTRKRPRLPRSGISLESLLTSREQEVLAAREAENLEGVPFIAEYIAVKRIPLRETHTPDSKIIGHLNTNEVVAVTKVWQGNEMKCHRLTFGAKPSVGWCSQRGRIQGGRLTVLLSRLTRQEWTSVTSHETSVAHRVATLRHMESVMNKPGVKEERRLRDKRMGLDNQPTMHKADKWVSELLGLRCEDSDDKESETEDPKAIAVHLLSRCKTDHEVAELIGLMERTQHAEWGRVGTTWLDQHQQMQERVAAAAQQCLQRQQQQQPLMPSPPTRTFASIDRALMIRRSAESKRHIMSESTGGATTSTERNIVVDGETTGETTGATGAAEDGQSATGSCQLGDSSSSCANVLWRVPQTLPLAESTRCLDPPPKACSSRRAQRLQAER